MKQHAIPQNILDIEFKLFTKFTVREFIYITIGVGFGGIFLYFYTRGSLPGIIAFPIFLISSAIGLALGLLPINDQKADVYLINFIKAINRPTRRVWRNEKFDSRVKEEASERGLVMTQGTLDRNGNPDEKPANIIGGSTQAISPTQFIENEGAALVDAEEQARIAEIEKLVNDPSLAAPINTTQMANDTKDSEGIAAVADPSQIDEPPIVESVEVPIQTEQTPPMVVANSEAQPNRVLISDSSVENYAILIEGLELLPNSVNMQLVDGSDQPIPEAMVLVKDPKGNIIQANQSNQDGLVISGKDFGKGSFKLAVNHDEYQFPEITYIFNGSVIPAIRIRSL